MSGPIDDAPVAPPTVVRHREGESLRDKLFYLGVVAVFTSASLGVAYFAPVLTLDCARDSNGDVSCEVHRRLYGFIPLSDRRLSRIVSVTLVESVHEPGLAESSESPTGFEALALACADGTSWQSHNSSSPLGRSMSALQDGIRELLDAKDLQHYHGWTAEKVPLLVASVFLLPAGLILLALLVKLVVPRAIVERKIAAIETDAARRVRARQR